MSDNQEKKTMQKIKILLLKHSSALTEKEADFVTNLTTGKVASTPYPKIHKSKLIKDAVDKPNSVYVTCESQMN